MYSYTQLTENIVCVHSQLTETCIMPIVKWQKWQKIWGQLTETLSQMAETPTQLTENPTQLTSENCLESFKSKNKDTPSFSPFFSKKTYK